MNWLDLLYDIFKVCIIPLLGLLTTFVIRLLDKKSEEAKAKTDNETYKKYITMLTDTITDCVTATNQTYVDALKAQGKFDAEAQKAAFDQTYKAVLTILSDEEKKYLTSVVGDLNIYITNKIEAVVNTNKIEG
jgi:hypothetical protein